MVSLRAANQTAGGFLEDSDVVLLEHRFVFFDYNGSIATPVPALRVKFQVEGQDDPYVQHYSAGSAERFAPSDDGETPAKAKSGEWSDIAAKGLCLLPGAKGEGLGKSSQAALYIAAIEAAGAEATDNDVTIWDDLKAHVDRRPAPKRNIKDSKQKDDATILLVTAILEDAPAKGGKTAAPAAAAKGGKVNIDAVAIEAIEAVLAKEGGPVGRDDVSSAVFKALKGNPDLKKVVGLINDDAWVADDDRPWVYNKKKDTLTGQ